ncbi:MAG: hypothetical protein MRY78_21210 [Saprospiraceae bacterium]|nr:hypothetical protein [Saprospiraceae bacterium]
MFLINIYLRFALMGIFLIGGIILSFIPGFGFWYALPLILIGLILLTGYILLGTVQSAATFMQTEDFDGCEKRLNLTLNPKWLYVTNRAYYYMIKGSIALAKRDTNEGEKWLQMANEIDVPSDNEKAMLQLQLANIAASKNKWQQAKLHFRTAKQCDVSEPTIVAQLLQFEKALAQRGQMKAANRMGGQGGGMMRGGKSKRRRPKMR